MVLHPLKDDAPAICRQNLRLLNVKQRPNAHVLYLHFDQLLDRLVKCALNLTNTNSVHLFRNAAGYQQFSKEVRLARPPATVRPLVAGSR